MTLSLRARNAIMGTGLFAFIGGVFTFSMMSVKQEDFSDVDREVSKERSKKVALGSAPNRL
jgi:hypothetical protein